MNDGSRDSVTEHSKCRIALFVIKRCKWYVSPASWLDHEAFDLLNFPSVGIRWRVRN